MHVGYAPLFQNPGNALSDAEVYAQELRLAEMGRAPRVRLGVVGRAPFHDYTMCPDVLQFLSYMAGKTQRVKLGSMVVVLPWHDPVRVAEQIVMLDHLSGGRVILGLGRGLARVEYEGFRIDQNEGRQRLRRVCRTGAAGPGTGLHRRRRDAATAAPRPAPVPDALFPGPYLRGGGVA